MAKIVYEFNGAEASSDESGKGDFFGGICTCVVYLTPEKYELLKKLELTNSITDSKSLNNEQIKKLAPLLMEAIEGYYEVMKINSSKYNELYEKTDNLNILLSYAHNAVWTALYKKFDLSKAVKVIDQYCDEKHYYDYLKDISISGAKIDIFTYRAESKYISCAMASIIARYFFIEEIEKIRKYTGINIPFGNSYDEKNSVIDAYNQLLTHTNSDDAAKEYCKNHFRTMEKIYGPNYFSEY